MILKDLLERLSLTNRMDLFNLYAEILLFWNKTHNLTSLDSIEKIHQNIFDSIYPLGFIKDFENCIDIGSGAGFPAIPLCICKPNSYFILTEPRNKRASFLQNLMIELDLKNIIIQKRLIQDLIIEKKVDLITSRAVMSVPKLIELSKKFIKKEGHFLFYKGSELEKEIDCIQDKFIRYNNRIYFYEKVD